VDGITNGKNFKLVKRYVTSAKQGDDMKPYAVGNIGDVVLPARSITSLVFGLQ